MNIPGFIAENSLYPADKQHQYAATSAWKSNGQVVVPQIDLTFPAPEFPHGRICRWRWEAEAGGVSSSAIKSVTKRIVFTLLRF